MSKQLAISACASVFAMAAFTVFATPDGEFARASSAYEQGATVEAAAPALDRVSPALFKLF